MMSDSFCVRHLLMNGVRQGGKSRSGYIQTLFRSIFKYLKALHLSVSTGGFLYCLYFVHMTNPWISGSHMEKKNRMSISERRIGIHGGFLYPSKYHPGTFKFITKYCPAGHSGVIYSGIPDFAKIDNFPQKCLKIPIFHPIFRCLVFILYIRNLSNMGKS